VYEGKCSRKITNSCMKMEKMRHVEIIPWMRGGRIKDNDGEGEFNYDIL
jgi:hypothetical protein